VASSTPSAQLLCCARISTPGSSSTYSSHPLASSSPLAPGTPSPLPLWHRRARRHRGPAPATLLRPNHHSEKLPLSPLKLLDQTRAALLARSAAVELCPAAGHLFSAGKLLHAPRSQIEPLPR
jgi:hypothetical protein